MILTGDVVEQLKTLEDGSVNCVVTSPPYYGLRDYGTGEWEGGDGECDHVENYNLKQDASGGVEGGRIYGTRGEQPSRSSSIIMYKSTCKKCGATRTDKQIGLEQTPEEYIGRLVEVFREVKRVLRADGVCWLNLGDSYAASGGHTKSGKSAIVGNTKKGLSNLGSTSIPDGMKSKNLLGIPWRVALALQADGWYLRSDVIWAKPNPMPESVTDRPTKSHEYVFLLTKSARYWYDADAIREPANYDGRKDTVMKGSNKLKNIPGQSPNTMFTNGAERWPNKTETGEPARNARTVWAIATTPYKGAHFAVFPPALVERCILAGCPSRVCVECGEPWVRVVEKMPNNDDYPNGPGGRHKEYEKHHGNLATIARYDTKTKGFAPTCQCCPLPAIYIDKFGDHWPRYEVHQPGVVLDPFFGSGTTGAVAEKLRRRWVGIELNPAYVELARDRIYQTQPALLPVE